MSSPLIIVGASARAAAQSARRAGLGPLHCGDRFADVDLGDVDLGDIDLGGCAAAILVDCYPHGLPAFLASSPVAPWLYVGGLENEPRLVDRLAALRPLLGAPGAVLRRVRDPWALAAAATRRGFRYPEIQRSPEGLPCDGSWLRKRFKSCGGIDVAPWTDGEAIRPPMRGKSPWYWQRRIEGTPMGATFVGGSPGAAPRAVLLGATKQLVGSTWSGASPFGYTGSVGPIAWNISESARLEQIGESLAAEFGLIGLFGVDLVASGDELTVLEVNPRYTASVEVLERARAMACLAYHVDACAGRRLPDRSELRPTGAPGLCGKAIVYARRRLVVAEGFPHWAISARDDDGWPLIADIPQAGSVVETGGPIATVMAAGSTAEEVEATLRQRADELRRRLDDSPT